MIESGDQGRHLQDRVRAIRRDSDRMQMLRDIWEDEETPRLIDNYLDPGNRTHSGMNESGD
jgi:hypothetical protein